MKHARTARSFGALGTTIFAGSVIACSVVACSNDGTNQVLDPVAIGMSATSPAFYDDGETTIFQAQKEFILPVRKPTAAEKAALGQAAPFPSAPFLKSQDLEITIRYTLSNLDDQKHTVELIVDPWNEFVRYRPGLTVTDEGSTPDFSGFDKFVVLGPKSRIQGTITPDDTRELAIDLATAENIITTPPTDPEANVNGLVNRVFYIQNRSSTPDPLISKYIPAITPGLTGFDVGIRSYEAGNIALEILVDVVDLNGDRTTEPGNLSNAMGLPPAEISPPAVPME